MLNCSQHLRLARLRLLSRTFSKTPSSTGKDAVVLLSGGLDSATTLAIAKSKGFNCHTMSFDYGQRHRYELHCAQLVARQLKAASHRTMSIDLRGFGHSALTDDIEVPKNRSEAEMKIIPVTYVPARNTIFLSFALALAEVLQSSDVFIGVNAIDYSGYPDCRPEYIAAYQTMARLATKAGVEGTTLLTIHTPLLYLTKEEIVRTGLELGVDMGLTSSCYDPLPDGTPCGGCDSCQIRLAAFAKVGREDPAMHRRKT